MKNGDGKENTETLKVKKKGLKKENDIT